MSEAARPDARASGRSAGRETPGPGPDARPPGRATVSASALITMPAAILFIKVAGSARFSVAGRVAAAMSL